VDFIQLIKGRPNTFLGQKFEHFCIYETIKTEIAKFNLLFRGNVTEFFSMQINVKLNKRYKLL
jgi:hypothetical protein